MKKQTVEERRSEILETTCEVVIERGFAGTRIADVAKRLGVSTSLIHYHYDSKEQLLAEAFSYYARKDLAALDAEIESAPDAMAQLDRAIQNYVPEGSDDVEWMLWIDAWGEALRNPLMKAISQELDEQSLALLERVLRNGIASGEFRCPDPSASALRLTGLIDGLAIQFAAHNDLLTREGFIDHVRRLAAHEVGVEVAAFDVARASVEHAPRPASITADFALRQLLARYCDALNRGDWAALGELWAGDATLELGDDVISGRANIVASLERGRAAHAWTMHLEPLALFEVDEGVGQATGKVTVREESRRAKDDARVIIIGAFADRYVSTPHGWQFAARRFDLIEQS